MMMPANFSAVSENEMTYVVGGSIADVLAPAMGAAQWKQFNTNVVTLIGNKFMNGFIDNTLLAIFGGSYNFGDATGNLVAGVTKAYKDNAGADNSNIFGGVLNAGLNIVGNLAAIYNLGFGTVGNAAGGAAIGKTKADGITKVKLVD